MNTDEIQNVTLDITVKLRSPFLFPSLEAAKFGLDAIALRDRNERPLIPSDQVRGVFRHALLDLQPAAFPTRNALDLMLGQGSADARNEDSDAILGFTPRRGRLLFSDLAMMGKVTRDIANRVEIQGDTGAANSGALMFVELVAPNGQVTTFSGTAIMFARPTEEESWLKALQAAASRISALGAMKSAGFGEVVGTIEVKKVGSHSIAAPETAPATPERLAYRLTIDRPFLVDARRAADNVYVGSEIIPGGALKGLLARHLELIGQLDDTAESLTALHISHAKPEGKYDVLPLSLVSAGTTDGDAVGDALCVPLGKGAMIAGKPASFSTDWKPKQFDSARAIMGHRAHPPLPRSVRMHVAIDAASGTAIDQKLYITNAVDPADKTWLISVDYSKVSEPEHRSLFSRIISAGMDGLGRTGASVTFEPSLASPQILSPVNIGTETPRCTVVLQTDAVMAHPSDSSDLRAAYAAYWKRVCPDATLENFYASQRLVGGYLARRFGPAVYAPFWLTQAGSVFLLSGNSILEKVSELIQNGLPAPHISGHMTDWQNCPFQPENGYGTISAEYDPTKLWAEVTDV